MEERRDLSSELVCCFQTLNYHWSKVKAFSLQTENQMSKFPVKEKVRRLEWFATLGLWALGRKRELRGKPHLSWSYSCFLIFWAEAKSSSFRAENPRTLQWNWNTIVFSGVAYSRILSVIIAQNHPWAHRGTLFLSVTLNVLGFAAVIYLLISVVKKTLVWMGVMTWKLSERCLWC